MHWSAKTTARNKFSEAIRAATDSERQIQEGRDAADRSLQTTEEGKDKHIDGITARA